MPQRTGAALSSPRPRLRRRCRCSASSRSTRASSVATLLFVRFALAAPLLWRGRARCAARCRGARPRRRAARAGARRGRLRDAGRAVLPRAASAWTPRVLSLILYSYPALVTGAAILLGREPANRRRARLALVTAPAGLVLVLAGAGGGRLRPRWAPRWALGAALTYTDLHPRLRRRDRRAGAAAAGGAGDDRRGGDAGRRPRRAPARWTPGSPRTAGCGSALAALVSTVARGAAVLQRHEPRRPVDGGDPVDARAAGHRVAGLPHVRRGAWGRCSWPARRRCSAAAVLVNLPTSIHAVGRLVSVNVGRPPADRRAARAGDDQRDRQGAGGGARARRGRQPRGRRPGRPSRARRAGQGGLRVRARGHGVVGGELGRELPPGMFGENLTTEGIDVSGAVIGERWRDRARASSRSASRGCRAPSSGSASATSGWSRRFAKAAGPAPTCGSSREGDLGVGRRDRRSSSRPEHGVTLALVSDAILQRRLAAARGRCGAGARRGAARRTSRIRRRSARPRRPRAGPRGR